MLDASTDMLVISIAATTANNVTEYLDFIGLTPFCC